jgi:RHS repeat-associated protein
MTRGGQRYIYLTDAQGSTTALTTISGAVANTYTYDAFGTSVQVGNVANPFTYTGQFFDGAAGLFLFPVRAYDPALGRFLSEDPLPALNLYPYVSNNPTNAVDPTGAQDETEDTVIHSRVHLTRRAAYWACIDTAIGVGLAYFAGSPLTVGAVIGITDYALRTCRHLA